jgi:hypothetical protein
MIALLSVAGIISKEHWSGGKPPLGLCGISYAYDNNIQQRVVTMTVGDTIDNMWL